MVLVLGAAQVLDGPVRVDPDALALHQRALAVVALVADVHDGVVVELHGEVVPHAAQHQLALADAVALGLADGPHAPGAVDTARSTPPTESVPDQHPVWARRCVSKTTLPLLRMYWRGSSMAGMWPSQVTSMATLCSVGSTTTRSLRRGSSTSMRKGPTEMSPRSTSGAEARTMCWEPPWRTSMNASTTPRFGYWP